ncbi:MAG: GFA family protein [Roseibium sp.]
MFASSAVAVSGKLSEFSSSSGKGSEITKMFCENCGSPIYGKNTRIPDRLTLSLGTIDDASGLDVEVIISDLDRPHWARLGDEVVSFATQPDWKPENWATHMQGGLVTEALSANRSFVHTCSEFTLLALYCHLCREYPAKTESISCNRTALQAFFKQPITTSAAAAL